jgi:glutathione S-transferase
MSLILHHLDQSRSQRILWLLEELGVPYVIKHHKRDAVTNLAPPELKAIHPLGKSPVLEDKVRVIAESAAIVEYLCAHHGGEALIPARESDDYIRHLELMHFAEGSAMTPVLLALYTSRLGDAAAPLSPRIEQELDNHFDFMESALHPSGHFIGDRLSAADVMLSFPAEIAVAQGRTQNRPKLDAFVAAMQARPAYQRGLEKGGPYNFAR